MSEIQIKCPGCGHLEAKHDGTGCRECECRIPRIRTVIIVDDIPGIVAAGERDELRQRLTAMTAERDALQNEVDKLFDEKENYRLLYLHARDER